MQRWILVLGAALCGIVGLAGQAGACVAPANLNDLATQIAAGLNANREGNGLSRLSFSQQLSQAAMTQACDLSDNNYIDHRGTDGSSPQDRARKTGYNDCLIAENLAWGYPDPSTIVSGWMQSSAHRHNMLLANAREFGVGIVDSARGPIWVLVLARSC